MKIVYIAHPIGGDVDGNVKNLLRIVRLINLEHPDVVPLVPYLADVLAMDDNVPAERERGMRNGEAVLRSGIVEELWLCGGRVSAGVQAEIDIACELGLPIKYALFLS